MYFFDSTDPAALPHGPVCLYADGDYAAGTTDLGGFSGVKWITVDGNQFCQIADFEPRNPVFDNAFALRAWAGGVAHQGGIPIVYTDRDNLPLARQRLASLDRPYLVWVATLDGDQLAPGWTPGLWAVQYLTAGPGRNYDTSVLYGQW